MRQLKPQHGLTLIELMVGIGIAAILMMASAPFFGDYIRNSRLREAGNTLLSEALFAQSEAIKLNATVRLSTNGATLQVLQVIDPTPDPDVVVLLRERTLVGTVVAPVATIDYGSEGRPVPFGTVGSIDLSMASVTCSDDARCPGLRVDAGGATRLCTNHLDAVNCP
jgi:type IV fimbrial biogenesis protein FimT